MDVNLNNQFAKRFEKGDCSQAEQYLFDSWNTNNIQNTATNSQNRQQNYDCNMYDNSHMFGKRPKYLFENDLYSPGKNPFKRARNMDSEGSIEMDKNDYKSDPEYWSKLNDLYTKQTQVQDKVHMMPHNPNFKNMYNNYGSVEDSNYNAPNNRHYFASDTLNNTLRRPNVQMSNNFQSPLPNYYQGNFNGNFNANFNGNFNANFNGNFNGNYNGNFNGNYNGNFNGNCNGNFNGNLNGNCVSMNDYNGYNYGYGVYNWNNDGNGYNGNSDLVGVSDNGGSSGNACGDDDKLYQSMNISNSKSENCEGYEGPHLNHAPEENFSNSDGPHNYGNAKIKMEQNINSYGYRDMRDMSYKDETHPWRNNSCERNGPRMSISPGRYPRSNPIRREFCKSPRSKSPIWGDRTQSYSGCIKPGLRGAMNRSRSPTRGRDTSRSCGKARPGDGSFPYGRGRGSCNVNKYDRPYWYNSSRSQSWDRTGRGRQGQNDREHPYRRQMESDRRRLIEKWRLNNCDNQDEMQKRLKEISLMNPEEILAEENKVWIRSAPADRYYTRSEDDLRRMRGTEVLDQLCQKFRYELVERGDRARANQTLVCPAPAKRKTKLCKHISQACSSDDSDSDNSDNETDDVNEMMEELHRKQQHPYRLHPELWYNDPGEMNDGPLCRCSAKARRTGIRHGFYPGEDKTTRCDIKSNNAGSLYHYRITISPPTNFLTRTPTIINHDDHEFIFEGFSLVSHYPIQQLPVCKVIRFNIEYIILYVEEKLPDNFTIEELDLFHDYLFREILELVDFDLKNASDPDSCPQFHFMPRFVRELPENGRELLPMCEVLKYLLASNKKLIDDDFIDEVHKLSKHEWQNFADFVKGMVVTVPGMKPCSLRVDQLDRECDDVKPENQLNAESGEDPGCSRLKEEGPLKGEKPQNAECGGPTSSHESPQVKETPEENDSKQYPEIVHFGIRPPQLSYAGNPAYQKAWREYVKFRHLLANMPKPTSEDKQKLAVKENRLQSMRSHSKMKRDVTITVSSKGFYLTGLMCDVVQHAMLIPVLVCHLRFHRSVCILEEKIGYKFKNRFLLQLALTHPSYRENFGTNPDHARNSLANCGIRQPEYGDRRIHYMNTRKRGINTLISIMSRFGKKNETQSNIYHNERLEFLGDAVVEFITSIHLFHIFRDLEEGGLATYRAALVQNQHLAVLAKKLKLDEFMLYAHGSDLCHDFELKHAMANCFEALMGALFLDGGIEVAGKVFGETLYGDDEDCLDVWFNYSPHPLQEQEPLGDRRWIPEFPFLQKLTEFEESIGIEFKHIRLLARAFTDRSIGYTNLTLGSNQRLEFLGDSVLQLVASDYLYKYFPEHHEGHLSLLRSSLVNNKTQAVVCDDLGMTKYAIYANPKVEMKVKDRADLLEAFLAALYVDSGLEVCRVFCDVCFFPRLQDFIMNQDWNDPKSKLQQCCLTQRTMDGGEPDIPIYKVVECKGPTNTRIYTVAVYFRNKRLAEATGHSIQQAEMNAAQKAMEISGPLFPQLDYQKRVIAKSLKTQKWPNRSSWSSNHPVGEQEVGEADRRAVKRGGEIKTERENLCKVKK